MLVMILRTVGVALLLYGLLVFVAQRRVAFPGTAREAPRPRTNVPTGITQVWLAASFGEVEAWLIRASDPGAPTLVFAHGNGELIDDWQQAMRDVARAGANVLLVEFPGYGHSEGRPTRATIRESFQLAYDWVVAEGGSQAMGSALMP